jgi:photosystem II stability/assembly factor-like uncharacterized protein
LKSIIFASILFCLTLNARAQQTQQIDSVLPGQWVRLNSGTTAHLGHVDYVTNDTIWVGPLRSTNAGTTWVPISQPGYGGFFQSALEGISLTDGTSAFVTHDAGQTWDTVNLEIGSNTISAVCWASPDTCFVVGTAGFRSTDGAMTWAAVTSPVSGTAISFCNSKVGYVVGPMAPGPFPFQNQFAGSCFKTTDGGSTWTQLFTAIQSDLSAVATLNPDTAIVIGGKGIYRTTDGGNSWNSQTPLFVFQANNVLAAEAITFHGTEGFMVGALLGGTGYIIHTTDAGVTWTQESDNNTPGYLYGVAILDDTDAIAVGDGGAILKRSTGSSGVVQRRSVDSLAIQVFPNPSHGSIMLQYNLESSQNVTFAVFDEVGRQQDVRSTSLRNGISLDVTNVPSGIYFVRVSAGGYVQSRSVVIQR